jgi:hypothetical protein
MLKNPSLTTRIGIGKAVGFVIGLIGFVALPYFWPDVSMMTRWGILLWYTTFGAIIGVFGVVTWHPVLNLPLPWWLRAPLIGGWMNFVLMFFAYEMMRAMLTSMFGNTGIMTSPYWFVVEGAIIGLLIGYLATRFGGEGKEAVDTPSP